VPWKVFHPVEDSVPNGGQAAKIALPRRGKKRGGRKRGSFAGLNRIFKKFYTFLTFGLDFREIDSRMPCLTVR
jgi:hypothetical protein